jgi:hypothetical protein
MNQVTDCDVKGGVRKGLLGCAQDAMAVVDDIAKEHNQLELNYACLSCTIKTRNLFKQVGTLQL